MSMCQAVTQVSQWAVMYNHITVCSIEPAIHLVADSSYVWVRAHGNEVGVIDIHVSCVQCTEYYVKLVLYVMNTDNII